MQKCSFANRIKKDDRQVRGRAGNGSWACFVAGKEEIIMKEKNVVLCGANSYEEKYYFNQDFSSLPESIQQEIHILCVLFTEDVGGILTLEFTPEGELEFKVTQAEGDYLFDEIGSVLKIKQYQEQKRELLESLELYYRVFFLGEDVEE